MSFGRRERLDTEDGAPPISVAAEPRIFGVVPPTVALVLGSAGAVAGLVLMIGLQRWPVGAGLFVAGTILLILAVDSARRWPASALAQGAVGAVDGAGARLGLARVFAGAWSQATRQVVGLRRELHDLRQERGRAQFELGGAAYREASDETRSLRERIAELDRRIERTQGEMDEAIARARTRVKRKRIAVKPTQAIAVEEQRAGDTALHPRHRG